MLCWSHTALSACSPCPSKSHLQGEGKECGLSVTSDCLFTGISVHLSNGNDETSRAHLAKKGSWHYPWSWQPCIPSLSSGCLSFSPTPPTSTPHTHTLSHFPSVLPAGMESTGVAAVMSAACYPIHPAQRGAARSWLPSTVPPTDMETSGLLDVKKSSRISVANLWQVSKEIYVKEMNWANFFNDGKKHIMTSEQPPCQIFCLCSKSSRALQQSECNNFWQAKQNIFHQLHFRGSQVSFILFLF